MKRKERVPSGRSATAGAPGTRAADGRLSLKAVRAKTRCSADGAPQTRTRQPQAGKSRKPQVPVETARHPVPARSSHPEWATGSRCVRVEGSPGFQGRGYLEARGMQPVCASAGTGSAPSRRRGAARRQGCGVLGERSRPGGRSSGARGDGSGHGESRAEAETLPGALDWGGGGYGAGVGGRPPCRRPAPAYHGPITNRGRVLMLTPAPLSLIDPGKGES